MPSELQIHKLWKPAEGEERMMQFYPGGLYCGLPNEVNITPEWIRPSEWLSEGAEEVFMAVVQGDSMKC